MENHGLTVKQIHRMVSASLRKAGIARGVLVLAAISGGRDSVVLLDVLCALRDKFGFILYAAHVDHGIRDTAKRDADFVRGLCAQYCVPLLCEHVDVPHARALSGESLEEAARHLRYDALHAMAQECHAQYILTAHHAADQTETVLMGLVRGSLGMLRGMREQTHDARGVILRPMLQVKSADIACYATAKNLTFCEDETNADAAYLRNRLRLQTIPKIKLDTGESLDQSVHRLSASLQRDEDCLQDMAQALYASHVQKTCDGILLQNALCDAHDALKARVVERVLQDLGQRCSYRTQETLVQLFSMQVGKRVDLGSGRQALRIKDGVLFVEEQSGEFFQIPICSSGQTVTPWGTFTVSGPFAPADYHSIGHRQWVGEHLIDSLFVRLPKMGERMQPFGLCTDKLLSDIMCDAGLDAFTRNKTPVVCDADGPLWIAGCRCSERLRLKAEQKAYLLEFKAILKE